MVNEDPTEVLDPDDANLRDLVSVPPDPSAPRIRVGASKRAFTRCVPSELGGSLAEHASERRDGEHAQGDVVGCHLVCKLRDDIEQEAWDGAVDGHDERVGGMERLVAVRVVFFFQSCRDGFGKVLRGEHMMSAMSLRMAICYSLVQRISANASL